MNITNSIDINADLGEFKNEMQLKNELNILKYISSCSIACGGHTGDEKSIKQIIEVCKENRIAIAFNLFSLPLNVILGLELLYSSSFLINVTITMFSGKSQSGHSNQFIFSLSVSPEIENFAL